MSLLVMTPAGEMQVPTQSGGGINLETLARITALEQELADLKRSVVTVTNATDVTQENGIALSAMQNNASVDGTLANGLSTLTSKLTIERYDFKASDIKNGTLFRSSFCVKFYGGICLLKIAVAHSSQDESEILTVPEKFRPSREESILGTGNVSLPVLIRLSVNGIFSARNIGSNDIGAFGTMVYMTN